MHDLTAQKMDLSGRFALVFHRQDRRRFAQGVEDDHVREMEVAERSADLVVRRGTRFEQGLDEPAKRRHFERLFDEVQGERLPSFAWQPRGARNDDQDTRIRLDHLDAL